MPVYQLPDGSQYELDLTKPDQAAWLAQRAKVSASPPDSGLTWKDKLDSAMEGLKTVGTNLGRGGLNLLQGIDQSLQKAPMAAGPAYSALRANLPPIPTPNEVFPVNPNESKPEQYARRMTEGAPTALLNPAGSVAGVAKAIIPSMLGPAAGQAAGDLTAKAVPKAAPWADMLANVLSQMGIGAATGPSSPSALENAGRDTSTLTKLALSRVSSNTASPQDVANQTSDAANKVLAGLKQARTAEYGANLGTNREVDPTIIGSLYSQLRNFAKNAQGQVTKDAYNEVADTLMTTKSVPQPPVRVKDPVTGIFKMEPQPDKIVTVPKTDISAITEDLKQLQANIRTPGNPTGGKLLDAYQVGQAYNTVQDTLKAIHPGYAAAEAGYKGTTGSVINPATESTLGKLADKNPLVSDPTPTGRLSAITTDNSPEDITRLQAILGARGASPADIARVLVQKKVQGGGLFPGERVFGGPGSGQEEGIYSLLSGAGVNPQSVQAPLSAADKIASSLGKGNDISEYAAVHQGGISLRGIVRPNLFKSLIFGNPGEQAVQKILADATPEELQALQKLSMFDPKIKLALAMAGAGRASFSSPDSKGQ